MSLVEFMYFSGYIAVAFLAAAMVVLFVAFGLHLTPNYGNVVSRHLPALLLLGFSLGVLVSGRNVSLYGQVVGGLDSPSGNQNSVLRIFTAASIGIGVVLVLNHFLRGARVNTPALRLLLGFIGYFTSSYVVSGILGTESSISYKTFYPMIIVLGLYASAVAPLDQLIRSSRDVLLAVLVVGMILIPIYPELVLQLGYSGLLPGVSFRYWGLASHANNIGPLAVILAILLVWVPYGTKWMTFAGFGVALATLVLSQSKTALIAAICVLSFMLLRKAIDFVRRPSASIVAKVCLLATAMALAMACLILVVSDVYSPLTEFVLNRLSLSGRATFTGRDKIWAITLAEWSRSPIVGYGPELWGDVFSARHGYYGIASNAHNQLLDTLGVAGVVGVTFFLVYLLQLIHASILTSQMSNGASIGLMIFLVVRSITEVPFKTANITTADFFVHALVLGIFMRAMVSRSNASQSGAAKPLFSHRSLHAASV